MKTQSGIHQNHHFFSSVLVLFFFLCITLPGAADKYQDPNSTLVACYFVGNDIESENLLGEWGFITQNLLDMRDGYSTETGDDLKIIIAYGGADKDGWRGMHVYSLDNATADYRDNGKYDQWDSYTASYPDYNMGSEESFREYLTILQPYQDYDRKYLIMSGHGGAYEGAFPDENFNTGNIPLPDMKKALNESGIHFDIIGLDTCLMGTLEVASILKDQADYLVVSEETEPSMGWNYYALTKTLVDKPEISPVELGRSIIDHYIPDQLNEGSGTLSLIDLNNIPQVITAWDNFSGKLRKAYQDITKKRKIEKVIAEADEFGLQFLMSLKTNERLVASYTMDIISFTRDIGHAVPELSDDAATVIESVNNTILYSRQNLRPYATGLSVYSPLHKEATIDTIFENSRAIAFSEEWYSFLIQFFRTVLSDNQKPVLLSSPDGIRAEDDGHVIVQIEFARATPEFHVVLGTEPAYPSSSGGYSIPDWNGQAFHFINPKTGTLQIIPVFYQRQADTDTEEYFAFARISDEEVPGMPWIYFDIFFNSKTGETKVFFVYLGKDEDNIISLSHSGRMSPLSDLAGTGITPYALVRYPDGTTTWKPVSDQPFIIDTETETGYQPVACGEYRYGLVATDLKGNGVTGYEKSFVQSCP